MKADIGIIGGSGTLLDRIRTLRRSRWTTQYGEPSDKIAVGKLGGKTVAFLPRHGVKHVIPPHKVPTRPT